MSPNLRRDGTFVVRIWWERRTGDSPLWRGQAFHAITGRSRYFETMEELVAFLIRWTGARSPEDGTAGHHRLPGAGGRNGRL